MSLTPSLDSRGLTGERGGGYTNHVPFNVDFTKRLTTNSARFGALSHHSFFSRHNPHPHRVRHIQGLNGGPVCMVRDDWYVTSSLYPHPLLKSHVHRKTAYPSAAFPLTKGPNAISGDKNKSALFSEAWREELKELTTKVTLSSQAHQAQKDKEVDQPEEELVRRKTQYSAETGRIIPPSSKSHHRRSFSQRLAYPQPLHDQELTVLELLCQILQTDSLSAVQQWLLLAGQREKDLVMGMIQQALDGVDLSNRPQRDFPLLYEPPFVGSWRKTRRTSSKKVDQASSHDKPERIGDAEVLEIHAGDHIHPQDEPLEHTKDERSS